MLATLLLLLLPQEPGAGAGLFSVQRRTAPDGNIVVTVEADRSAITCFESLVRLGEAMNWNVDFESKQLEADLRFATVDLNFAGQAPRTVGQLIAGAGGADVVFDPGNADVPVRPTLHVVRPPGPATEAGRQRLRVMASQWYRSFLLDELQHEPLVQNEATNVRMNLASLLVESGDLESAIEFFVQVCDDAPNPQVPAAMLRIAQCNLELAGGQTDVPARTALFAKAEKWARQLLAKYPSAKAANGATVALGRALLGLQRYEECRAELAARALRLLNENELLDVSLLIGDADLRLQKPGRVYEQMLTLRQLPGFGSMTDKQFLDYHFLLGYGALGADKHELAMQALEWFLINGPSDRRRGLAYVMLGQSYMAQGKFLEARAAAVEVRQHFMPELDETQRRAAIKLFASSGLQLGDREEAYRDLEVLVHRQDDPELALFLIDELMADKRWAYAISVARVIDGREDNYGDLGRLRRIEALYEQGRTSRSLGEFPLQAVTLALKVRSPELRSKCSELIGKAYEELGKPEYAADAYRGILR